MAVTVIQLVPVDPSLATNSDFAKMQEYIIGGAPGTGAGGTYYVVDNNNQTIYEWSNNTPGPANQLIATGGSYTQFQAFLAANPPVVVTNTASYPTPVVPQNEQTVLLRGMLLALISLATQGGNADTLDFYPQNAALS
jgi:hypothetical protein